MPIQCYCSEIRQCEADSSSLQRARDNMLDASDQLNNMITHADSFADSFAAAASPENLGSIVSGIGDCNRPPCQSISDVVDALDDAITRLTNRISSMRSADRQYHAAITEASFDDSSPSANAPSGFASPNLRVRTRT